MASAPSAQLRPIAHGFKCRIEYQNASVVCPDNVRRLQRIVDDVLELAPSASADVAPLDASAAVGHIVRDWAQTAGVQTAEVSTAQAGSAKVWLDLPDAALPVHFDAEHLRRVLVNLLDNALRHGSADAGALLLRLAARNGHSAVLSLASDGPPIAAEVEPHLFEPFFSTRSRGSGLGLYICRELCERYGASIEFRARDEQARYRNGFVVILRRAPEHDASGRSAPAVNTPMAPGRGDESPEEP